MTTRASRDFTCRTYPNGVHSYKLAGLTQFEKEVWPNDKVRNDIQSFRSSSKSLQSWLT